MPDCGEPFTGSEMTHRWCGQAARWFFAAWVGVLFLTWGLSL